jgi:hypothetical protein
MDPTVASDIEPAQLRPDLQADPVSAHSDQIDVRNVLVIDGNGDASASLEAVADVDERTIKIEVNLLELRGTVPPSRRNRCE